MRLTGRFVKISGKEKRVDGRILFCELCGAEYEVDPESGEFHCPVCEEMED